ncbi:MAG TPA: alpha/beta hydrolase [Pyrinomonadaceae bacterium]|nr:alpha/beta hydrolase [Pyrinomonadaceae bacterium]
MSAPFAQAAITPSAEFNFTSSDGLRVACFRWDSRTPVRGVVQIAHGMGEHVGRYGDTIEALVSDGFTVYGNDHRGHGHTAPDATHFGDFGSGGFDLLVDDMIRLSRIAKEEVPGRPFFLFGHSLGSFAAQQYALDRSGEIDGLILSGSGALDRLARILNSASGASNILNAAFEPARTPFDWLSSDPNVVDAFINDSLCFAELQPPALSSFLASASQLANPHRLQNVRDDLPIYLFSGSDDPVGEQLDGVQLLIYRYAKAGLYDISHDFYQGKRHEMLNEINKDEVRRRLLTWIASEVEA